MKYEYAIVKDNYYPNGQLKYKGEETSYTTLGGIRSTWVYKSFYEDGEVKSTWTEVMSGADIVVTNKKCFDNNGQEISCE
jgi:antitoxin component YwqK of YwqJK toxin-antitoxin module